jgi:hypothetical protein
VDKVHILGSGLLLGSAFPVETRISQVCRSSVVLVLLRERGYLLKRAKEHLKEGGPWDDPEQNGLK